MYISYKPFGNTSVLTRASFSGVQSLPSAFLTLLQNGESDEFSKVDEAAEVADTWEDGDLQY